MNNTILSNFNDLYLLEPLEELDEQETFLSILYHDSHGGNAIRMFLDESKDNKINVNHFANKDYRKLQYREMEHNCYTTINTFKSYKRLSDEVYNYSGIYIDLDAHSFNSIEKMDAAIERTKERLKKAYKKGEISVPTMITETGRGLGIFYILKHSIANSSKAQKSIKYLDQVRAALMAKYKSFLNKRGYLEVDSTVKDNARVCRMPLTMNKKVNRWCRLIHISYNEEEEVQYYDLKQLAEDNHLFEEINKIRKQIALRKVVSIDAYKLPFLTIRLQKLGILQELRNFDCSGHREYMTFAYFNAATQIYGNQEAIIATKEFNNKFKSPLPDSEIDNIIKVSNNNVAPLGNYEGFYKIPDSWIIDKLEVTDEENKECHFGASKRQIERQNIKKKNILKREERNKKIADYILANPGETYPEIAKAFDVSESMIYRICKEYDIKRNLKKSEGTKTSKNTETAVSKNATNKNLQNLSESLLGVLSFAAGKVTNDIYDIYDTSTTRPDTSTISITQTQPITDM